MTTKLETLASAVQDALGGKIKNLSSELGEVTVVLGAADYPSAMQVLRDHPSTRFEQMIDLCGVDYQSYGDGRWEGARFGVVVHLMSITHNWRLRVRTFAPDDDMPLVASLIPVWPAANWYEREAFDLFGFMFTDHPDLRRILTDYGFVGYPFRKDFPMIGKVEMRYDDVQKRVVYQPVSIEERNNVPRIIREEGFHNG